MPGIAVEKPLIYAKIGQGLEGDDAIDSMLIDKIEPLFASIWGRWTWKAIFPGLQALYVERDCLKILQGQMRDLQDFKLGSDYTGNQQAIFTNIRAMLAGVEQEIAKAEMEATANRPPAIGTMAAQHMGRQDVCPNPSSGRYRGDMTEGAGIDDWDTSIY